MDEVPEILLCEVSNEVEAAMVVNLLSEDGIAARSDANQAMNVFGGLPFEPGHSIFVACHPRREKLARSWTQYPHFKKLRNVHEPES